MCLHLACVTQEISLSPRQRTLYKNCTEFNKVFEDLLDSNCVQNEPEL